MQGRAAGACCALLCGDTGINAPQWFVLAATVQRGAIDRACFGRCNLATTPLFRANPGVGGSDTPHRDVAYAAAGLLGAACRGCLSLFCVYLVVSIQQI